MGLGEEEKKTHTHKCRFKVSHCSFLIICIVIYLYINVCVFMYSYRIVRPIHHHHNDHDHRHRHRHRHRHIHICIPNWEMEGGSVGITFVVVVTRRLGKQLSHGTRTSNTHTFEQCNVSVWIRMYGVGMMVINFVNFMHFKHADKILKLRMHRVFWSGHWAAQSF